MNKKNFIFIAIIIIAIVAFFVISSREARAPEQTGVDNLSGDEVSTNNGDANTVVDTTSSDDVSNPQTHTMVLDANGYKPRDITITAGDTIVFSTTAGRPFWPASNRHPIHRIYPALDPKSPIQPEDMWEFVFDRVGEWKYHDHLAPHIGGTITVVE